MTIKGPQQITFDQPADQQYGDELVAAATGSDSGLPVTYTAGPAEVCTADGASGSRITVRRRRRRAPSPPTRPAATRSGPDAAPVVRTPSRSLPAPLDDHGRRQVQDLRRPRPRAHRELRWACGTATRRPPSGGLVLTGTAGRQRARTATTSSPSGAANPHYDISYVAGTMTDRHGSADGHPRRPRRASTAAAADVHRGLRRARQRRHRRPTSPGWRSTGPAKARGRRELRRSSRSAADQPELRPTATSPAPRPSPPRR